jgi:hypothetical protein
MWFFLNPFLEPSGLTVRFYHHDLERIPGERKEHEEVIEPLFFSDMASLLVHSLGLEKRIPHFRSHLFLITES